MSIDEDKIRARAYRLWEEDGRPQGRHDHHWQQALSEISSEAASGTAAAPEEAQAEPAKRKPRAAKAAAPKTPAPKPPAPKPSTSKPAAAKVAVPQPATAKGKAAKGGSSAPAVPHIAADVTPPVAEAASAEAPQPKRRRKVTAETA